MTETKENKISYDLEEKNIKFSGVNIGFI